MLLVSRSYIDCAEITSSYTKKDENRAPRRVTALVKIRQSIAVYCPLRLKSRYKGSDLRLWCTVKLLVAAQIWNLGMDPSDVPQRGRLCSRLRKLTVLPESSSEL